MDQEVFKNYLMRDKSFLKSLYEGNDRARNNRILTFASDTKLNTLIRFLHCLSNGEIKIAKDNFDEIHTSHKLNYIKRNVEKKAALNRLLKSEREDKIKFLKKLSTIYSALLYTLFNEI